MYKKDLGRIKYKIKYISATKSEIHDMCSNIKAKKINGVYVSLAEMKKDVFSGEHLN